MLKVNNMKRILTQKMKMTMKKMMRILMRILEVSKMMMMFQASKMMEYHDTHKSLKDLKEQTTKRFSLNSPNMIRRVIFYLNSNYILLELLTLNFHKQDNIIFTHLKEVSHQTIT
jgi:hypothetical protein